MNVFIKTLQLSPEQQDNVKTILEDIHVCKDELEIELFYPRNNPISKFVVGLCDVRAADSIRISYDFERDGYKIEQPQRGSWDGDDKVCDPEWIEVAFIKAWAKSKDER